MKPGAYQSATLCYLVAVLLLGGASAAGFAANLLLQVAGALLLVWSMRRRRPRFGWFAAAFGLLAIVQFIPLPPAVWSRLPGREGVEHGFAMLGSGTPWLTLSLAPWSSLASLVWWVPALSLFAAMRADADLARPACRTIVGVAAISAILGIAQYLRGIGYFYAITNYGKAPGFFANSNHQSLFLLIALILCVEDLFRAGGALRTAPTRLPAVSGCLAILLFVIGIVVNDSLAVLILLVPVSCALTLILHRDRRRLAWLLLPGALAVGGCALLAVSLDIFPNDLFGQSGVPGIGRHAFWSITLRMVRDFAPVGSGLGTFQYIYHWYENPAMVGPTYVNHAHNDLLELLAETGVFGLAVLTAFLAWLLAATKRLGQAARGSSLPFAALVIVLTGLLHSLVDYPLRTAALSGVPALACGIIASFASTATESTT